MQFVYFTKVIIRQSGINDPIDEDMIKSLWVTKTELFDELQEPFNKFATRSSLFISYDTLTNVLLKLKGHYVLIILDHGNYSLDNDFGVDNLHIKSFNDTIKPMITLPKIIQVATKNIVLDNIHLCITGENDDVYLENKKLFTFAGLVTTNNLDHVTITNCKFSGKCNRTNVFDINKDATKCIISQCVFDECHVNFSNCGTILFQQNTFNSAHLEIRKCNGTFYSNTMSDATQIKLFDCGSIHMNRNIFNNLTTEYENIHADYTTTLFMTNNIIKFNGKKLLCVDRNSECVFDNNRIIVGNDNFFAKIDSMGSLELISNLFSCDNVEIACYNAKVTSDDKNRYQDINEFKEIKFIMTEQDIIKPTRIVYSPTL